MDHDIHCLLHGVQPYGDERRAVMSSGLPVVTYKTKKACGQRLSGGAGGGDFTTAGSSFSHLFTLFVW